MCTANNQVNIISGVDIQCICKSNYYKFIKQQCQNQINIMQSGQKTQFKKKLNAQSCIKEQLKEDESESEGEYNQIMQTISQLLPAYYQYRRHLIAILKQNDPNTKNYQSLVISDDVIRQKTRRCQQQRKFYAENKQKAQQSKLSRMLITQNLILKHKKKVKEDRQLQLKYEKQQIQQILGYTQSKNNIQYEQTFHPQNTPNFGNYKEPNQRDSYNYKEDEPSIDNHQQMHIHKMNNNHQPQLKNKLQQKQTLQANIQKVKQTKSQLAKTKNHQRNLQQKKSFQRNQLYKQSVPNIRINYKTEQNQQAQDSQQNSQDDNFSNVNKNTSMNMIEVDETYSEHKPRKFIRHNTPNFQTYSQRPSKTNNFFDEQRLKMELQKKNADMIHNEISIAIGYSDDSVSQKSINKSSNSNYILQDLQSIQNRSAVNKSTGRMSTREYVDQFISSASHIISEIVELNCRNQCLKFIVNNRQYEIITNIYDQNIGKGPVFSKLCIKKIQNLLRDQQKNQVNFIINKIFRGQNFISFEDFAQSFNSNLSQNQNKLLSQKYKKINPYQIKEILKKIFSVWLQINYFQIKLKKIVKQNSMQMNELCSKFISNQNQISINLEQTQRFIYNSTKNRVNSLKIHKFFSKHFPSNTIEQFSKWLKQKQYFI